MLHLEHIEALLEKYWEGDTTLEEERMLKTYFASSEVADGLRQYAPLFQVFREEQSVQFSKKATATVIKPVQYNWKPWAVAASVALLLSAGWWWSVQPGPTNEYVAETTQNPVQTTQEKQMIPAENPPLLVHTDQVPAVTRKKKMYGKQPATTQLNEEEEMAIAEIKAALALVSSKLRKGRQEAAKGTSHLDNVDKIFKKKKDSEG